jgi:predicted nucleic acid-binding protein
MTGKTAFKASMMEDAADGDGIYLDASALAKLYIPEPESESLEACLRGRRDLLISELTITEVISALARRRREGELSATQLFLVRDAVLAAGAGSFRRLDMSPAVHREAEQLLLGIASVALRALDALHIALALSGSAKRIATFDARLRAAALHVGLKTVDL